MNKFRWLWRPRRVASEHVVYRTAQWYGPEPLLSQGSEVVLFFEELGRSSSGDVFGLCELQFCWAVRMFRCPDGRPGPCRPAMAAEPMDHIWTLHEWLAIPVCKLE